MRRATLPVLILFNAVLAGLIAWTPSTPEPGLPRITDTALPAPDPDFPSTKRSIMDSPDAAETAMFGLGGASEKKSAETPMKVSADQKADEISLLGVLIVQQDSDRQSVVSLLRHGQPPVVSRLVVGGILEGWKLVSATRTTVTLLGQNGSTRILQVGSDAKAKASR